MEKLERYELAKIWASTSYHLSLQLALHQAVRIPGIGTFAVVRKRVALGEQDLVIVERPVFQLEQAVAQDHELRCGCIDFPGHQDSEQLPYAEIASENAVSEGTVQLCMKRTTHLFHACLENRQNVAIIWRDVGMLIVQGKEIKMRFYLHFLERLNGTGKMLQALLEMPEMRDSVISRHDTAASQTSSGRVFVLPWYKLETVPEMPTLIDLKGRVKGKEDVAEKRLLCRARLSPNRLPALPVKPQQGQRAEGSEPRARQLPVIQRSCLKEKEEKGKLPPLVAPREVDFIARAIETREKNKREKKKKKKKKEKLPQYIQKYLNEEKKKKTELAVEEKSKEQSTGVIEAKAKAEKEAPNGRGKEESQKEMQRSQESSSSECSSDSSTSSVESDASSCDLLEIRTIMENWEEAEEEPPTVPEDNTVPPKRSLSPRTDRALREVVTCILGQVARKRRGERDEQLDLQDKLQCCMDVAAVGCRVLEEELRAKMQAQQARRNQLRAQMLRNEELLFESESKTDHLLFRLRGITVPGQDDSLLSWGVEEKLQYLGQKLQYLAQRAAHLPPECRILDESNGVHGVSIPAGVFGDPHQAHPDGPSHT
ncbi:hypothetical protein Q9966_011320 [Columba livia]|nr:hypothetical protein Q9966_011320 [Columba livia]